MSKTRPLEFIRFPDLSEVADAFQKIAAIMTDKTDEILVNTIKECARKEGITQLYLMDRRFIINALKDAIKKWEDEHGTEESD